MLALLGALAWFVVIRPAQDFLNGWRAPQTQSQTGQNQPGQNPSGQGNDSGVVVPQLPGNDTANNEAASGTSNDAAPAATGDVNAPVTRAEVQKFVRVRRDVRQALGTSFTGLQEVWTDIQSGQNPNLLQVVGVLRNAGGSVAAARNAQTAALQRENLSPERYAAVRSAVNRALGLPNVDFARAAEALQRGQLPDLNGTVQTATAQEKALVEPFRKELLATSAAGLLGL
ncbi:hypothetical protein [Deinococcus malanensis]|uniref:hypothetical protein n=1 Tax=Deinococcus malanensis TaxID=1706855 RepID=UPI001E34C737|nr:hypothetical protein [Deinococcus malanensis]